MAKLSPLDRALVLPIWASASWLGQITNLSMPFMLGMLVDDLRFSAADAGILLSTELCIISCVCMAISPLVGRIPKRAAALAGAILALAGNLWSLRGTDLASLLVARSIAGVGCGVAMAVGNAVVAGAKDSARLYDRTMMLLVLTQVLVDVLIPPVIRHFETRGFFAVMAAMNLLMIPLMMRLPRVIAADTAASSAPEPGTTRLAHHLRWGAILLVIAVVVLLGARESTYWSFLERIGAGASIDAELVGQVVGFGTLLAVAAPATSTFMRNRFGEVLPTVFGVLGEGLVLYLLTASHSKALFMVFLALWPILYCYTLPLVMGIAARLDSQGRVIAIAAGALQIAFSVGPIVAGGLVQWRGLGALGGFAVASTATMVLLVASGIVSKRQVAAAVSV
jgi:predicted MFS family arabinose efflux permease